MNVYICRKEHFNAAHRLFNPKWSDAKNAEVFGLCASPNFHGHNYEIITTVCGQPHEDTGYVIDAKRLSQIIQKEVIVYLDHKNLNLDVEFMRGKLPSTENLAVAIWDILFLCLQKQEPSVKLYCIEIYETPKNFVRYYGK